MLQLTFICFGNVVLILPPTGSPLTKLVCPLGKISEEKICPYFLKKGPSPKNLKFGKKGTKVPKND